MDAKGDGAIEGNVIRLNTMDDVGHDIHHHDHMHHDPSSSSSSTEDPKDPRLKVYFMIEELKVGKVMPIYFPNRHLIPSLILSKHEADNIPFSSKEFQNLLNFFSLSQGSPQALAMEIAFEKCEEKPIEGETRFCATSLESIHEFAQDIFGFDTRVKTLTTKHQKNQPSGLLQNYKVTKISQNIPSPKLISCHTMPYPYAIFYCHAPHSESKVFMVSLEGENGDLVEAVSVCHMDTSKWRREHVAFSVLGVEPGTTSVCHFFPSDHFVLVPASA